MYVKKYDKAEQINFLASAIVQTFTEQISDTGVAADANGRKIVKAGSVWPANDETAKGLVYADTDVTEGPQPGAVLVEAYVLEARLPAVVTEEAKLALKEIKFR